MLSCIRKFNDKIKRGKFGFTQNEALEIRQKKIRHWKLFGMTLWKILQIHSQRTKNTEDPFS